MGQADHEKESIVCFPVDQPTTSSQPTNGMPTAMTPLVLSSVVHCVYPFVDGPNGDISGVTTKQLVSL
jgi:hypothetical protein